MREIKFRAWDKENKEIVELDFVGRKVVKVKNGEWENRENFVVMQYTGLKDKNGTEIYEGDIVKGLDPLRDEWIGEIKYLAPYYALLGSRSHLILSDVNNLEVIGNIYENPELLGDAK